jgi:hypothetical protein
MFLLFPFTITIKNIYFIYHSNNIQYFFVPFTNVYVKNTTIKKIILSKAKKEEEKVIFKLDEI